MRANTSQPRFARMCNAYNHPIDCPCGFGGDTGGRGAREQACLGIVGTLEPVSAGWAADSRGTVESYVNPNAHCPVCDAVVFYYRSQFDGRVYFDRLGWPWPKHGCTNNFRELRRTTKDSVLHDHRQPEAPWRLQGGAPFFSSKVHSAGARGLVTGNFRNKFLQLHVAHNKAIDPDGPVFLREKTKTPGIIEITFLSSNPLSTHPKKTFAYCNRLTPLPFRTILGAARGDPVASYEVGRFLLWELDDPVSARPYLQRTVGGGVTDALLDIAIVELFRPS
jgi:hypothetical protein